LKNSRNTQALIGQFQKTFLENKAHPKSNYPEKPTNPKSLGDTVLVHKGLLITVPQSGSMNSRQFWKEVAEIFGDPNLAKVKGKSKGGSLTVWVSKNDQW